MTRAVYQVRLQIKPEDEAAFNDWYEGTYIPRLMRETPHFTAVHRYVGETDNGRVYITDYETTVETMDLAIAEMRAPGRAEINAEFYRWKDRCITLHESIRLHETLALGQGGAPLRSLSARIQAIEDRIAIDDLVSTYCLAIDERNLDRFLALFSDDAVLRHEDGIMRLEGLPAIRDYYTQRFAGYGVTFHTPHSRIVEFVSPVEATGVVTGHAEMGQDGELVLAAIRYTDRYRKVDGRWLFAERVLGFWYYMKASDLPAGFADGLRKHYRGEHLPAELPESLDTYKAWLSTKS